MRYKGKSKKIPISSSSSSSSVACLARSGSSTQTVSSKVTQSTITAFHTLLKRQSILTRQLKDAPTEQDAASIRASLRTIEREMSSLGGLEAYQQASKLGQSKERGGDSSKVLVKWLKELDKHRHGRLRMLEIGALAPDNYASSSRWIDNHPIDLHSQHPDIVEQDFFLRSLPGSLTDSFDVISCSLVLNFVSSPQDRGRMLKLIHSHLRPSTDSLLYLVLPLPCVTNSRYISTTSLSSLMKVIGFELVKEQWRSNSRVGYWLWRWAQPDENERRRWDKKTVEQDGPGKNNFSIIIE